jgi:beta-xylosidase
MKRAIFSLYLACASVLVIVADAEIAVAQPAAPAAPRSWVADNGNGTYTNPLFYEEFSDPDVIRVGDEYFLTGTTMHTMPGLPVLRSKDLVNWELASYAFERLELAPGFRLEGAEIYGQGIWAPCIRHHNGTFYIFSNINNHGTQVFRSKSPAGPWQHNQLGTRLYDLGVLFDDDGKIFAVHGVNEISLVELNAELTDVVPNTNRVIIPRGRGMGEGLHFYKIKGRYYIVSAIPGAHTPMVCARANSLDGPWEIETMVAGESLGVPTGNSVRARGGRGGRRGRGAAGRGNQPTGFDIVPHDPNEGGGLTVHQGGIVDTPSGQWWTVIMQDHKSLGRVSCLLPITWSDDWPLIGLTGNLRRAPATWIKPDTGHERPPKPLFVRHDSFDSGKLQPIWQWNHMPDDTKWSLTERPGFLRLHSRPAADFWWARNTLTQRAVGPQSTVTVELQLDGMRPGDVAGLALLNQPYVWIAAAKSAEGVTIERFDQTDGQTIREPATGNRFWFRAVCDYDAEKALLSCSTDGTTFHDVGPTYTMAYQLRTFQGIRYSLFHFNRDGAAGGFADFGSFDVQESERRAMTRPIPYGRAIVLTSLADDKLLTVSDGTLKAMARDSLGRPAATFRLVERGLGRVALESVVAERYVSVAAANGAITLYAGEPGTNETFQWIDLERSGDVMLMSLATHRYLVADPAAGGAVAANHAGPRPDRKDGSSFEWTTWEE